MNRDAMLERIGGGGPFDVVVIGGGATGLGCALDAAARGYRTALFERGDFAGGTSSRSTKLIHGGVRYLRRGNVRLVLESLRERSRLFANAPHLVHDLRFIIPAYRPFDRAFYGAGLALYDALAGPRAPGRTTLISRADTLALMPTLAAERLRGAVTYHDAQFDDARLALALAATATRLGAVVLNYCAVISVDGSRGAVSGVRVRDVETGAEVDIAARVVVNATGVFADAVRRLDDPAATPTLRPSRGSHIVLDADFLPGRDALMIPRTDDGRVLFAIPWHGRVIVGTTEVEVDAVTTDPVPSASEVDFLLEHAGRYLSRRPALADVRSAFAGLRPLVGTDPSVRSSSVPRDHEILVSRRGLVTIVGGKWTTYRQMAEDAVDRAAVAGCLPAAPCQTASLRLDGRAEAPDVAGAVRDEMARTVVDVIARRSRLLITDARAAAAAAPAIAREMAALLGRDASWEQEQIDAARETARRHAPGAADPLM